ncbi:MAG: family peptidase [Hyphomicrobiales bacterium]|nr:family peptidase [Hyphomicrobiales bacterium]
MFHKVSMSKSAGTNAPASTRYFVSLQTHRNIRCISLHPVALLALAACLSLGLLGSICGAGYLVFKDDILAAMVAQHRSSEHAYQVRIANLQTQLDRVSTRQLIDQETLETRIVELATRQAKIESRSATLASLAELAGVPSAVPSRARGTAAAPLNPLLAKPAQGLPAGVSAYTSPETSLSTITRPTPLPIEMTPQPDPILKVAPGGRADGLRTSARIVDPAHAANRDIPMALRARVLAASLENIELAQVGTAEKIAAAASQQALAMEAAFASTGLDPRGLKLPRPKVSPASGGPFIPLVDPQDQSLFGVRIRHLQETLEKARVYRQVLPYVPLRQPLSGTLDITSTFGGRADPFYGRAAMHSGIDMRDEHGSPVRATAAGRVTFAGVNGGYGNMVEIDHGNGLTTRYAHLSSITVSDNQWVDAGDICGRLGSTGRSTGPHLHYEVRVDGDAVDPARFLRAGARLPTILMARADESAQTARQ